MIPGRFISAGWHNLCSKFNPESKNSMYESRTICLCVIIFNAEDMIPEGVFSFDVAFWPHRVCETKSFIKYSDSVRNPECILCVSSWCLTSRLYFPPCLKTVERAYVMQMLLEGTISSCQGLCVHLKKEGFLAKLPAPLFHCPLFILQNSEGTLLVERCLQEANTRYKNRWLP